MELFAQHSKESDLILDLVNKHLKPAAPISTVADLDIIDLSGMSNLTYIVSLKRQSQKIVIRFFINKTSDFELESQIFSLMGKHMLGPKEIESTSDYRVEEFVDGRALTFLEMRNPSIASKLMLMLCEMNYDGALTGIVRKLKGPNANFSNDFIRDKENGWFAKYMKEVRPILLNSKFIQENERAWQILQFFERITLDQQDFIQEYENILSGLQRRISKQQSVSESAAALYDTDADIVFSHNDFQENNVLIDNYDKTKLTLIDFEYASLNYRGFDIAAYVNECFMDYSYPLKPKFKIYEDDLLDYLIESQQPGSELEVALTNYLKHAYKINQYENTDVFNYVSDELPLLKEQVYKCILLSHIQWSFWALIMMPYEKCKESALGVEECLSFYMEYAYARMKLYYRIKDVLNLKQSRGGIQQQDTAELSTAYTRTSTGATADQTQSLEAQDLKDVGEDLQ